MIIDTQHCTDTRQRKDSRQLAEEAVLRSKDGVPWVPKPTDESKP